MRLVFRRNVRVTCFSCDWSCCCGCKATYLC